MSSITIPSAPDGQPDPRQNEDIMSKQSSPVGNDGIDLPADANGLAIGILATAAVIFTLESAQGLLISLILGVIFAYTLNPAVVWLERIKIPRVLGAAIVVIAVLSVTILGTYALRGQVQGILTQLPAAVSKLSAGLDSMQKGQRVNMKNVQAAATAMEKVTNPASTEPLAKQVVVVEPTFEINNFLWVGSKGALQIIGQVSMVLFLVYFLLLAANTFKRKLVRITGPPLSRKKITVLILDDINSSIQRYMLMLLLTNVLVGLLAWLAFRWIGLENAGAWAVAAGLLHIIPYFGPGVVAVAVGVAAYMQSESLTLVLLTLGSMLAISTLVGIFITTWMTGRIAKMNTAAVFISLLFWSWLWGLWGMLLSMPIIVIVKVVTQHVPKLKIVSELLSE
jgi:predicted PurR-regulated permease PerM